MATFKKPEAETSSNCALEQKLNILESRILGLESKQLSQRPVVFNGLSKRGTQCYRCPITYDNISIDTHSALNSITGKYSVPVSGHYLLQFHAVTESKHEVQIELCINGIDIAHLFDNDSSGRNRYVVIHSN